MVRRGLTKSSRKLQEAPGSSRKLQEARVEKSEELFTAQEVERRLMKVKSKLE
jgi:hypothetical protein